jgi:hypothetical protein
MSRRAQRHTALGQPIEMYRDPVFVERMCGGINSLLRGGSWS